ncbi:MULTISPECIES: M42 family peptidase [Sphaerochaeta]|jgi:putative aminopeptidase FrvX|uniref:M42 family peptidase n=1 Tax=Sphaerochaeta associata TaxID=1129264 RepID=A0ABY4D7S2_9SPIR|nr:MULTISPECIES: M42 family peptidase [Sphaerochaeta]MDT3358723.1 M42 family peptidase [Spirochaetota bacterium]MDD3455715.1 M42 family peptidase [Sphaerochaeta sp.]MDD4038143.1 M42 family peptidase [Sphaerochaeta sp.]MDX9983990.1 M42 family peptidase [Sphaerochaeta sp.]MEA5027559.1 M42 family peptidase [Sphaerochaeta associata]
MNTQDLIQSIKRISDANGISGFEDEVLHVIRAEGAGLGTFEEDRIRNLYLYRHENKAGRPIVQLNAHTDEVGFMVKAIRPDGMIEFIAIGGWIPTNVPAHMVRILNKDGVYVPAVVASKPPHFMSEAEKKAPLEITNLVLDVGASSSEEVIKEYRIGIAAPVVPEVSCTFDEKHGLFIGKAFDCRIGCASTLATLKELQGMDLKVNLVGDFSSQEEVGTRGSIVSANTIKADLAIVFEGCPADDTVVPSYQAQTCLKKGPMLRHIDSRMITNPRFQRYALNLAQELGIPVQEAVRSAGATNGAPIHLAHDGIPAIVIGVPVRYAHTHYGISALFDVEQAVRLAKEILLRMDSKTIRSF